MTPGAEIRRKKVLEALDRYGQKYAFFTSGKTLQCCEEGHVYLCVGIRDVGTFDLSIPADKYDPFELLKIINGANDAKST